MIYSSIEFLLFFLPLFLVAYGLTPARMRNVTLLSGSLIFYAFGEPRSLLVLMVSVMVNFFFGLRLEPVYGVGKKKRGNKKLHRRRLERKRRLLFAAAVLFNVGLLGAFKYVLGGRGMPLGISFYTFQSLSYLIDVYRGEQEREVSFGMFATYITMFPQLLSGPLVSYLEVGEALRDRSFGAKEIQEGLKVFTMGLVSKVLLADRIGLLWQEVQVTGFESISTPLAWLAAVAYSLKIYFDFYGYSLMAVGVGRMLGFALPDNFRTPYMAASVREFYRRWHITLGEWFCRYIYIPLGGNRRGEFRTVCNLLAVWFLTAVWHGRTANFLIWGMMLWVFIVIERQLEALGVGRMLERVPGRLFSHLYLWAVIPVTWMCFAITDITQLQIFLGRMFGTLPGVQIAVADWQDALRNYGILFGAGFFACTPLVQRLFKRCKDTLPGIVVLAALFWLCVRNLEQEGLNPFMYLDF